MPLTTFDVFGPFEIPRDSKTKTIILNKLEEKEFWEKTVPQKLSKATGCYVLATKSGRGYTPWYVGMTTRSFMEKSLNPPNQKKMNQVLAGRSRGTPCLFLLPWLTGTGKITSTTPKGVLKAAIGDLESFLISLGLKKNRDIKNIQGTKSGIEVKGFLKASPGQPKKPAQALRAMFGI